MTDDELFERAAAEGKKDSDDLVAEIWRTHDTPEKKGEVFCYSRAAHDALWAGIRSAVGLALGRSYADRALAERALNRIAALEARLSTVETKAAPKPHIRLHAGGIGNDA